MTILAFVYVPLNLVTSIFGMNIQQLNSNGQQLYVFVITALLALLITFGIWLGIEFRSGYVQWVPQNQTRAESGSHEPNRGRKDYGIISRLAILVYPFKIGRGR